MANDLNLRYWLGMGGVPPHDTARAYLWEKRLHWVMVGVALLAIPAFYLEALQRSAPLQSLGWELDLVIFAAFSLETLWMTHVCRQKWRYLGLNWLNLMIIFASGMGLLGLSSEWIPLIRLLRVAYVALILARMLASVRQLFATNAVPYAFALGIVTLTVAGAGFYWLEPTIHSFGDGLWLAFVTGATIGYGDYVPTTTASRLFAVLMVVVGFTVFSLVTASISAFFVGEDEKSLTRELHHDIRQLRKEIAQLREEMEQRGSAAQAKKEVDDRVGPVDEDGVS